MKSPITGKEMILQIEKSTLVFRKEELGYDHTSYLCVDSGESYTTTDLDEFNLNQVYNQYRHRHKIPFAEEIRGLREKYSFSYADISKILGLGANTYSSYEKGEVPSLSIAALIKEMIDSAKALEELVKSNNEISEPRKKEFLQKIAKVMEGRRAE